MDRIDKIISNQDFIRNLEIIDNAEINREFCKHDLNHLLDVARIAYIYCLENNYKLDKEIIYATALMHDIGRSMEYQNILQHDKAAAIIVPNILNKAGFNDNEIDEIIKSISIHREKNCQKTLLDKVIYYADKKSRNCFYCKVREKCNWDNSLKNKTIL